MNRLNLEFRVSAGSAMCLSVPHLPYNTFQPHNESAIEEIKKIKLGHLPPHMGFSLSTCLFGAGNLINIIRDGQKISTGQTELQTGPGLQMDFNEFVEQIREQGGAITKPLNSFDEISKFVGLDDYTRNGYVDARLLKDGDIVQVLPLENHPVTVNNSPNPKEDMAYAPT